MNVEFLAGSTTCKCVSCDRVAQDCYFFRIRQVDGLHPAYRTLYNPKCRMCSACRDRGDQFVESEIHRIMGQYIGG